MAFGKGVGESKNKSIGALWKKTSKDGQTTFLSGNVEIDGEKFEIVVFKNTFKDTEKHPDYKIYPSKPMEKAARPEKRRRDEEDEDEVPF